MVSAQRQFLDDVIAVGSSVKDEFKVACLADEEAVGSQNCAVGIGDREAEFAGTILRAERDDEQEQKGCVDRNTAQIDSPRPTGNAFGIFYSDAGWTLRDGSATTFGRERRGYSSMSRLETRPSWRSSWTGETPRPHMSTPPQKLARTFGQ